MRFDAEATSLIGKPFGFPHTEQEAKVALIAAPFELSVSYRRGTSKAPQAILKASAQIDHSLPHVHKPWQAGAYWICLLYTSDAADE